MTTYKTTSKNEDGFTLVELAIVMIIIGLLIGGILKGQALIENARISAGVSQLKGTDSAVSTFRDAYNAFPGDMTAANAAARIPNCAAAPCNNNGNGNGRLALDPSVLPALATEESAFWAQLSAADIMGGIVPQAAAVALNQSHPEFEVAGSIRVGYYNGLAAITGNPTAAPNLPRAGHYLAVGTLTAVIAAAASDVLSPGQAFRLDTKIDDGSPNTGSIIGAGTTAVNCMTAGVTGAYATARQGADCSLYMRIQG